MPARRSSGITSARMRPFGRAMISLSFADTGISVRPAHAGNIISARRASGVLAGWMIGAHLGRPRFAHVADTAFDVLTFEADGSAAGEQHDHGHLAVLA